MPNKNLNKQGTLLTKTRRLLKGADIAEVAAETGLSFYWLNKIAKGEIKDPSVNKVQRVYEKLSRKKLC